MYRSATYSSPVGEITLCSDGDALRGLWIEGQKYHGGTIPEAMEPGDAPVLAAAKEWLDAYFAGERPAIADLPLAPIGSEFRQMVWRILTEIPYGQVTTYGAIAQQVARELGRDHMASLGRGRCRGAQPHLHRPFPAIASWAPTGASPGTPEASTRRYGCSNTRAWT